MNSLQVRHTTLVESLETFILPKTVMTTLKASIWTVPVGGGGQSRFPDAPPLDPTFEFHSMGTVTVPHRLSGLFLHRV